MHRTLTATTILAVTLAQLTPALAQDAPAPADRMARPRPEARPAHPQTPPLRAPRPGGGFNGGNGGGFNGGNGGGNGGGFNGGNGGGGFGGNGGNWQGGNRPRPPVVVVPPPGRPQPDWNNGWNGSNWGGSGGWNGGSFRCESQGGRYRQCGADTSGGVRLVRNLSGTQCRQGRNWGWRNGYVWVNNGCRGEFQTRYGGGWNGDRNDGPSTGAVIGGVAVAAGLIALLAASSKKSQPQAQAPAPDGAPPAYVPPAGASGQPARIAVPAGAVTSAAQPAFDRCLAEAARQIGATGGTEIQLDRIVEVTPGNGGYRFRASLRGIYPDEARLIPTFCRATPSQVVELTFG